MAIIAVLVVAFLCMIPKLGEDMDKKQIGVNQIPFTGTLEYWTNGGFQFQKMGTVTIYDKTSQIWFNELIRNWKIQLCQLLIMIREKDLY